MGNSAPRVLSDIRQGLPDDQKGKFAYLGLMARVKKALSEGQLVKVPAIEIRPYPDQPRKHFNKDRLGSLKNSVSLGGQTTVALMRHKPEGATHYELIDGERRWRGIMGIPEAERPLYEAKLIEADDDVIQYLISGIANFNREPHTAEETVDTIVRMHEVFEIPMPEIATLLGIGEMWANQLYGLRNLIPEGRALLSSNLPRSEQLQVTAAIQISKADPSIQKGILKKFRSGTVRMAGLRAEVVRTARETKTEIRTREVPPHKRWSGGHTKVGVVDRMSSDLLRLLRDPDVVKVMKGRLGEKDSMLRLVKGSMKTLSQCETILERIGS